MTNTMISTAARRIVREANSRRPGFRLYFDADGHLVNEVYGPEAFGPNSSTYHLCIHTGDRGRPSRITQAAVQDELDAIAAATEIGWPGLAGSLLDGWRFDDECGKPRRTTEQHAQIHTAAQAEMEAEWAL